MLIVLVWPRLHIHVQVYDYANTYTFQFTRMAEPTFLQNLHTSGLENVDNFVMASSSDAVTAGLSAQLHVAEWVKCTRINADAIMRASWYY